MEKILADQGEPNAYIAGREASGAFVVGLRYGSGTLVHKVEGERPVYWTGPSVGFDVGGDATRTFILVYNLYDAQDLYRRFGQVEGRAYFIGGLSATYMRRGDVVVENFSPGIMAKYKLDYESLKTIKPDLVYCSISGFGQTGRIRSRAQGWAGSAALLRH